MKIYISGFYCGTNPQPGVGMARSLRQAYPDAVLIGVEFSNRCSGLHWPELDELWLQRPWKELDLHTHADQIRQVLDSGAFWVSGIDLEILWLADVFPDGHPRLLTPPLDALQQTGKPAISAHTGLPVKIPTFVSTRSSDWDLHAFCRRHDWKVWLKGPYYEAVRIKNWASFETMRAVLARAWSTERLFLQANVTGYEESIALSAYRGELVSCVRMRKRDLTELNKTWAGDVSAIDADIAGPLREIVRRINWTGGAELEMVRDADGQLWLLEWNPRFPAWIHGATIAGHNLPACLIEAASGLTARHEAAETNEFTRVVLEIPVRSELPLAPLPEPFAGSVGHSLKHPSGLLDFAGRLHEMNFEARRHAAADTAEPVENLAPAVPAAFAADLLTFDFSRISTPSFLFFEKTAADLFDSAGRLAKNSARGGVKVTNAYSIKTNPDARLIQKACEAGFLAEAITPLEVNKALEVGFRPEQVILNGPGKWWRREFLPDVPLHAVFSDSTADLRRVVAALQSGEIKAGIVGIRLRTPTIHSRFGIPVDAPDVFTRLIELVKTVPEENTFGIHFHMASSGIGVGRWWNLFESMLRWSASIEMLSGRPVECLDIGGGWFPDDMSNGFGTKFSKAVAAAREYLPNVREVISEPGKAVAQPSMGLATRILEIQDPDGPRQEVVVDGSIAELPMYLFYPHRILFQNSHTGAWEPLRRGTTRLLGRLCMEHDVVAAGVELPETARPGDVLIFCDAGAYDRSMSYEFGRG